MKRFLTSFACALCAYLSLANSVFANEAAELTLKSPNGHHRVILRLDEEAFLRYQVMNKNEVILEPSKLGFRFALQTPLERFELLESTRASHNSQWQALIGERKNIVDHYQQLTLKLKEREGKRKVNVVFRAFDDGIAFRYVFPKQKAMSDFVITDELTEFHFASKSSSKSKKAHQAWWIEANYDSYERLYQKTGLDEVVHVNTPFTLTTPAGTHMSLHEAALTDYASMTLKKSSKNTLEAELVPWADGSKVKGSTPFKTPWRTIQISDNAGGLLESSMILNLNEPNMLEDTSWIQPMTYIGIWWGIHIGVHTWKTGERHGATTERAMEYIDFAAKNNIGGVLFEGWNKGWEEWGKRDAYVIPAHDFDLEKVAAYAREKGIRIIGHNETGGNVEAYEKHVEEIFGIYADLGITTVKTGYVAENGLANGEHHQGQWAVNHYRRIVKLAAKYKIMLNAHEPIKDTGIRRTYPNMLSREGARGGEWDAWSKGNPPEHTLILPFTRMLAGPMDYTPGIFDVDFSNFEGQRFDWFGKLQTRDFRVHSTLARQLANMVILYSPLQMAADMIENYQGVPAFEFIRHLKADFDESYVPHGKVGEYITIVRKSGEEWFVGSATDRKARTLELKADFLPEGQQFNAVIYRDADDAHWQTNPEAYLIENKTINSKSVLPLKLAPGGGLAIHIIPL